MTVKTAVADGVTKVWFGADEYRRGQALRGQPTASILDPMERAYAWLYGSCAKGNMQAPVDDLGFWFDFDLERNQWCLSFLAQEFSPKSKDWTPQTSRQNANQGLQEGQQGALPLVVVSQDQAGQTGA